MEDVWDDEVRPRTFGTGAQVRKERSRPGAWRSPHVTCSPACEIHLGRGGALLLMTVTPFGRRYGNVQISVPVVVAEVDPRRLCWFAHERRTNRVFIRESGKRYDQTDGKSLKMLYKYREDQCVHLAAGTF